LKIGKLIVQSEVADNDYPVFRPIPFVVVVVFNYLTVAWYSGFVGKTF
jgi:hypothetical protein